jgi:hypothetical protein
LIPPISLIEDEVAATRLSITKSDMMTEEEEEKKNEDKEHLN